MSPCLMTVAAALFLGADAPKDETRAELQKLQGTWRISSVEIKGIVTPADAEHTLVISGDKTSLSGQGRTLKGAIRIAPAQKPKAIDFLYGDDEPVTAIYELSDDVLKVCEARPGAPRPTKLSSKGEAGGMITVYKRVKK